MNPMLDAFASFIGKFHPLLIHFPVAILSLIVLWEGLRIIPPLKRYYVEKPLTVWWFLAFWSSVVSALTGFLLYSHGEYGGNLVNIHKWGGMGLTVGIGLVWILYYKRKGLRRSQNLYTGSLILLMGGMVYTAHQGGSLTHGSEFLTWEAPVSAQLQAELLAQYEEGNMQVYPHAIQPMFKTYCMSCHNSTKTKGGLNMEQWETLLAGGKSGKPSLVPGSADSSELYIRIALPPDDSDHMPPEGKKPMPEPAIAVLKWWIEEGADPNHLLVDSLNSPEIKRAFAEVMPEAINRLADMERLREERQENWEKLQPLARKLHVDIQPDPAADSALFSLALRFPPAHFDDQDLQALLPYAHLFSKLSLPGAEITDDGLFFIGQMPNLKALYIPKTCINGEGMPHLLGLENLEILNVSGTQLSNTACMNLLEFPALTQVYLFRTEVSPNIIEAMNEFDTDTKLSLLEGPYF